MERWWSDAVPGDGTLYPDEKAQLTGQLELSESGFLPVGEVRICHFHLLFIPDDTRSIIRAVITKQNVNSLLEGEKGDWVKRRGSSEQRRNSAFILKYNKHACRSGRCVFFMSDKNEYKFCTVTSI